MKIASKNIWITGASSGIGEALSLELARRGATVFLSARNEASLQRVQKACEGLKGKAFIYPLDVTQEASIYQVRDAILAAHQHIDMLINNSGISQRSLAVETPISVDRQIMEVNYFGAVNMTKAVLPHMIGRKAGHLVSISSIVGKFGFPLRSAYSASKHALHGYFESVRAENQSKGIEVTIVCPGRVKTNISLHALTKEGKAHGQLDQGQEEGISAESCARQIANAMESSKKEVWIGGKEILMVYIRKYLPFLFYRMAAKVKPT